ncbi:MAG TPA: sugar ABC transporter permease [Candidatus Hungatella pullicola]|nr:sugar ABC transporter permease [Candidatus Hungatella pullicola]
MKKVEPYLYLLPAFIFFILFVYYPFLKNEILSFFTLDKFRTIKGFAGLGNYVKVLTDETFIQSIINTLIYVFVTVPVSMVIGYFLALLCRKRRRCSSAYEAMFAMSMATSASVMAMIFQLMYNPSMGIINKLLGIQVNWLNNPDLALLSIMMIQIWSNIGYNFIFILSGLRGISDDIMESANVDGVKGLQLQTKIILPLISPTILFLCVKDIAYAMTTASFTLILTQGGPGGATETMISYIYKKGITGTNYNVAFAATTICFLLSAVMMAASMALEGKKVHYES